MRKILIDEMVVNSNIWTEHRDYEGGKSPLFSDRLSLNERNVFPRHRQSRTTVRKYVAWGPHEDIPKHDDMW